MLRLTSRVWLSVLALALTIALVACGGGQAAAPAAAPTTAPAAKPTEAPKAAPTTAPAAAPTTAPTQAAAPKATEAPKAAATTAPTTPPTGKPLKIGLLSDTSGSLAIYGPMLENGFKLGLEYATQGSNQVAGRPIEVIIKDTASKPETATSQARELIEKDGVDLLVGVPSSGAALAVAEIAKNNKKIYIAEPAASPDLSGKNFNEYVFRTSRTSVQDALTMGAALTKMGKKFVQVAPDYAFGYGSAAGFYAVVKGNGGSFVVNDNAEKSGAIYIPQDTTDFTPYLQQVLDSKAEVLIVTWAGAGFVPLFQQMQQLGIFKAMTVATGMGDNKTLASGYKEAIGSVGVSVYHYVLPKNPVNDWLVKRHQELFKSPPDLFTAGGFAAAQMAVEGLKKTNGDATADKLIPVLEGLEFQSPKGLFKIRKSDHVALQPLYLVKLTNVSDPEYKFFDLVQELKPDDTAPPCALEGTYKSRCQ